MVGLSIEVTLHTNHRWIGVHSWIKTIIVRSMSHPKWSIPFEKKRK